jgi:hypothetical protein
MFPEGEVHAESYSPEFRRRVIELCQPGGEGADRERHARLAALARTREGASARRRRSVEG